MLKNKNKNMKMQFWFMYLFSCISANYQNEYQIVSYRAQNCYALLQKLNELS